MLIKTVVPDTYKRNLLLFFTYSFFVSPKGSSLLRQLVAEFIHTKLLHGGPPTTSADGLHRRMYMTAWQRPALGPDTASLYTAYNRNYPPWMKQFPITVTGMALNSALGIPILNQNH